MGRYIIRRSLFAIPTLLAISLIIFGILDLAPGDPTSQLPLNVPVEVRDRIRESLGFDDPFLVKYTKWLKLMVVNEPVNTINSIFGTCFGNCEEPDRIISWSSRTPAFDIIIERVPQTVWVLGIAFVIGIVLAKHAPRRPWRPSVEGGAKSVLGPGGELPTEGASVPLGDCTRWCEKAEPTRSGRAAITT